MPWLTRRLEKPTQAAESVEFRRNAGTDRVRSIFLWWFVQRGCRHSSVPTTARRIARVRPSTRAFSFLHAAQATSAPHVTPMHWPPARRAGNPRSGECGYNRFGKDSALAAAVGHAFRETRVLANAVTKPFGNYHALAAANGHAVHHDATGTAGLHHGAHGVAARLNHGAAFLVAGRAGHADAILGHLALAHAHGQVAAADHHAVHHAATAAHGTGHAHAQVLNNAAGHLVGGAAHDLHAAGALFHLHRAARDHHGVHAGATGRHHSRHAARHAAGHSHRSHHRVDHSSRSPSPPCTAPDSPDSRRTQPEQCIATHSGGMINARGPDAITIWCIPIIPIGPRHRRRRAIHYGLASLPGTPELRFEPCFGPEFNSAD